MTDEPGQPTDTSPSPTLARVVDLLDERYPPSTAEDWDAVGLVVGDPQRQVRRVLFAVDPVADVVDEAVAWGADLVVTHHPLLLKGVHSVAATTVKGSVVHRLVEAGCALYVAHTNGDAAERGVNDALADLLGIVDRRPLDPHEPGAATGLGRVGRLASPTTLRAFAEHVAAVLPATAQGVRASGDLDATVETVAVLGGSGDSFIGAARAAGADVYVTSDLKHHGVSEAREQARLDALAAGAPAGSGTPFLIDTAHFASEWPWLAYAAEDLVHDCTADGTTVVTRVSVLRTDPWTARFGSPDADDLNSEDPTEGHQL
ncbi:Nif3-like dinuclear metal center hexameric protein [Sanguibacter sp. Leaf3]|uniref:Nif3-like dinuclear metal center hexameric protein n=1 Tax=Sanguibacter sp. Leaf3 TaxID=1736209 RepID=UPI0006FFC824|nr:Nif3-like dinuclear metal center hexameric protein [Sanguibacter sp. Leaf3]KQT97949.1 Nif3-like dinuclear metal center hexameric protein [Sanguibacter sp. Leaf3]